MLSASTDAGDAEEKKQGQQRNEDRDALQITSVLIVVVSDDANPAGC
jgi:hypothetical protein